MISGVYIVCYPEDRQLLVSFTPTGVSNGDDEGPKVAWANENLAAASEKEDEMKEPLRPARSDQDLFRTSADHPRGPFLYVPARTILEDHFRTSANRRRGPFS